MTLFDEYNGGENRGNGHRKKPKAIAVIVDHVKDENNDGAVSGGMSHSTELLVKCQRSSLPFLSRVEAI